MAALDISVKLNNVFHAFTKEIEGRNGSKTCLCIPLDDLSVDGSGNIWLNIDAYEQTRFEGQTHSMKQRLTKEQVALLPKLENGKPDKPFIGSVKNKEYPAKQGVQRTPAAATSTANDDDLPF